jgi:hypothetical protein
MRNEARRTRNAVYAVVAMGLLLALSLGVAVLSPTASSTAPLPAKVALPAAANLTVAGSVDGWEANVAACGSGAVIGATGGAIIGVAAGGIGAAPGAAIGAGVGCIAGFAGFHLGAYFAGTTAASSATAAEKQFQLDQAANLNNFGLGLAGMVNLTQSQLDATFNAWSAMTDAVAPTQLPNATFNPLIAINSSGVALQQMTLVNDYANLAGAYLNSVNAAETSGYGPGGPFVGGVYGLNFGSVTFGAVSSAQYYGTAGSDVQVNLFNTNGLDIRSGGTAEIRCGTGGSPILTTVPAAPTGGTTAYPVPANSTTYPFKMTPASDEMLVLTGATSSGCSIEGNGILGVPVSTTNEPGNNVTYVSCQGDSSTVCDAANFAVRSPTLGFASVPLGGCAWSAVGHSCVGPTYASPPVNTFSGNENTLFLNAETSAKAYWLYLHLLGYNSSSAVPSNCIIPQPSQVLPPSYSASVGDLTLNQTLSLYSAWMNALATFFNTPYNVTNFCHGHPAFNLGYDGLWSVDTEVTGFVYTLPVAAQVFGTRSTWTVNNASTGPNRTANGTARGLRTDPTALLLYPSTTTLNAPIGRVQYVPVNDPVLAFVPANGTLYQLSGNGTTTNRYGFSNGTVSGVTGAAFYISTCAVLDGSTGAYVPQVGYCNLALSSIANVSFPFVSPPVPPIPTGGCAGSSTFLLGPFVSFWTSLTGSSSLGCGVAEFAAIVTVIVILVVIVYVIAAVWREV